jgi:hypothetical protein
VMAAVARADPQHHASHAEPHHATDAVHHADAASASGADADEPTPSRLSELARFKCSACASCCTGAALPPPAALAIPAFVPAAVPGVFVPVRPVAFFTDGPERPPRRPLA